MYEIRPRQMAGDRSLYLRCEAGAAPSVQPCVPLASQRAGIRREGPTGHALSVRCFMESATRHLLPSMISEGTPAPYPAASTAAARTTSGDMSIPRANAARVDTWGACCQLGFVASEWTVDLGSGRLDTDPRRPMDA